MEAERERRQREASAPPPRTIAEGRGRPQQRGGANLVTSAAHLHVRWSDVMIFMFKYVNVEKNETI